MTDVKDPPEGSFQGQLEGYKFQFEGGRSVYYFLAHIIIEQYSVDDEEWSLGEVNVLSDCTNHNTKWMRIHKDQSEYEKALNTFLGDPELCDRLVRYLEEQRDIVTKRLQKTDFQGLSDDELKDLIDYTSHQCGKSLRPSIIIRMADLALIPRLMRMFADKKDRDELVAVASVSEEPSFTLSEEMDLLSLAMKMKNGKLEIDSGLVAGELSRIKDTYCFSEMGYFNERAKTIEDFKERLEEMIYGSPEERLEEIKSERKRLLEQKTAILKQVSKEDQQIIRIASRLSHIKDCCKAAINKVIYNTEPLFREIAAHTNETVKRIKDLSPEEIKQLVDKRPIKWETIQKRTDSHILITFKKKFYALTGQEAERFRRLYQEADRSEKEFTGRCASRGHVTGKARIVLGRNDFSKMEKDDILIVMNTSPDFTPILKIAKAVVAEEGGLTAHVSIISRELKVPAVVGISRITSILKDGDLVEVDANKGIVRRIGKRDQSGASR